MLIYCLIPARKGSQRIKNKNRIIIKNKFLINYTINSALNTNQINKIFVSTNDPIMKKIISKKVSIIKRPESISESSCSTESCVIHFLTYINKNNIKKPDAIVLLQCTSPLRKKNDISNAIKNFKEKKLDSLFSAVEDKSLFWIIEKKKLTPINYKPSTRVIEQKMKKQIIENGSIYIFKTDGFMKSKCRLFGKIGFHLMKKEHSFQIDEKEDVKLIKKLI